MTVADPTFDKNTNTITIPDAERREYLIGSKFVSGEVKIEDATTVLVRAKRGYKLPQDTQTEFHFDPSGVEEVVEVPVVVDETPAVVPEVTPETVDNRRFGHR